MTRVCHIIKTFSRIRVLTSKHENNMAMNKQAKPIMCTMELYSISGKIP